MGNGPGVQCHSRYQIGSPGPPSNWLPLMGCSLPRKEVQDSNRWAEVGDAVERDPYRTAEAGPRRWPLHLKEAQRIQDSNRAPGGTRSVPATGRRDEGTHEKRESGDDVEVIPTGSAGRRLGTRWNAMPPAAGRRDQGMHKTRI